MLEASDIPTPDTSAASESANESASESVLVWRQLIERLQAEVKFERTRNEALNFEIARLKRWRFGSSAESLEATTQAVLFDAILADTSLEDQAAKDETTPPPAAPRIKRKAVRQALPAHLPRLDRHYDLGAAHCACGQAFKRIGEELSEQLDCVPAQFFVLRHIRGLTGAGAPLPLMNACACCQRVQVAPMPAQMIDLGLRGRACWRKWPSPRSTITCRCTARPKSTPAQAEPGHKQS